jgi:hypothetical protein
MQIDFPRRHALDALRNLIPDDWEIKTMHPDLSDLTEWAVEARYPGNWPEADESDAISAISEAQSVYDRICVDLRTHGWTADRV